MQRRKPDIASTCQVSGVWVYRNLQVNVIGKWNITTLTGRIQNRGRARAFLFPKKKTAFFQRPPTSEPLSFPSLLLARPSPRRFREKEEGEKIGAVHAISWHISNLSLVFTPILQCFQCNNNLIDEFVFLLLFSV